MANMSSLFDENIDFGNFNKPADFYWFNFGNFI